MELEDNIFKTAEDTVKQDLIKQFITTARVLYEQDEVSDLSDETLAQFLNSRLGHTGKALEALAQTLAWRKQFDVNKLFNEDFSLDESSRKLHFFGKAIDQSAILIYTAQRQEEIKNADDINRNLRFIMFTIEKGRRASEIHKITLLMDMSKAKYAKNEVKLASVLIPLLQKHYPEMLARCYVFPTNGIFWMTYSASKYFLDTHTIPKIYLKDSAASLNEWISRDQFYSRFGGSVVEDINFEEIGKKSNAMSERVLKSNVIEVEEIFSAPIEFQTV